MEQRPASWPESTRHAQWWWVVDPRQSLRARAALWVAGSFLLFTLIMTWLAGMALRRSIEQQVGSGFETLAYQISDKLDRTIFERARNLQLAADLPQLRSEAASTVERRRVLDALQGASPEFAWIGLVDAAGRIVAGTQQLFEGDNVSDRPWFRAGRGQPFVGTVREFPQLARHVPAEEPSDGPARFLDLAVPVAGENGTTGGVLAAHLRWGWAREVQLSVLPEAMQRQRIGATVYASSREVLLDSGASGWTQPPEPPSLPENRRLRGMMVEDAHGANYLSGYMRSRGFRDYRGTGWLTVVRQPVERVFAPVGQLQRTILAWGFFFTACVSVLAWVAAGRLVRRVRSVSAAAERIRSGDILALMPLQRGNHEMERMCGALGQMVDDFRAKQAAAEPRKPESKTAVT